MSPTGEVSLRVPSRRAQPRRARSAPHAVLRGAQVEPAVPTAEATLPLLIGAAFAAVVLVQVWLHATG